MTRTGTSTVSVPTTGSTCPVCGQWNDPWGDHRREGCAASSTTAAGSSYDIRSRSSHAISGMTRDGRMVTFSRNVPASAVVARLTQLEDDGMTRLSAYVEGF